MKHVSLLVVALLGPAGAWAQGVNDPLNSRPQRDQGKLEPAVDVHLVRAPVCRS